VTEQTITLPDGAAQLLREAAANDGTIFVGDWSCALERKTARALVRAGMLSCGHPRGSGWHAVTKHGREWLAANPDEETAS